MHHRAVLTWLLTLLLFLGLSQCSALGERLLKDTKQVLLKNIWDPIWGPKGYHWQACDRLKEAYAARVAGQDAHLASIARTVCRHITKGEQRVKPLVVLITGPPGVGKTWTTRVTAQALYSNEDLGHILPKRCDPTIKPCEPFLQISAYSYVAANRQERHTQLLDRLKEHVEKMPQSFIVFEDFDRFDCSLRDFIRDMIEYGPAHGLQWTRSIIVLTSNAGASRAAQIANDRAQNPEAWAEHDVQRLVEEYWRSSCTSDGGQEQGAMVGLAKMIKLVDRFLAFNALSHADVQQVFRKLLVLENTVRSKNIHAYSMPLHDRLQLDWDEGVTSELASRQMLGGYSGGFARQGASKCTEAVEQMLDLLENVKCPSDISTWQTYRIRKGPDTEHRRSSNSFNLEMECVPVPNTSASQLAPGRQEM